MNRIEKGKHAEQAARDWLIRQGFTVLHQNWRSGRYEIDLVAEKGSVIHCIEVRSVFSLAHGLPENSVSSKKQSHMYAAAQLYMRSCDITAECQVDVLSVCIYRQQVRYAWFEHLTFS